MSKFSSYDDLPLDVAYELERLEHELQEGDITQKGYDKKKSQILAPYQDLLAKAKAPIIAEPSIVPPEIDMGPEPSAADVVDFLDFLPSPTHSPSDKKGSQLMEQHIQHARSPSLPPRQPPPQQQQPLQQQQQQQQQQFRPPPLPSRQLPPQQQQQYGRPFDPRLGSPRPVHNYPMRPPPPMNGFRPPPPPPPSSSAPNYRPYPFRPSMNGSHHTRSTSIESGTGSQFGVRQSMDSDWENRSTIGREASVMSAPSRIRHSNSTSSNLSSLDMPIRRSQSSQHGRSRYRDSYMATTFKAIEPAPQPKLDPMNQMFIADLAGRQMSPLKGRGIPFPLLDTDGTTVLTDFSSLAKILRFRGTGKDKLNEAFSMVDARGKETVNLSWEKLLARAEKIAQSIREKGKIQPGDRIALIYRKSEVLEFIPAFFACFLAGVTAVPINAAEDLSELSFILTLTNIYLVLTTDHNQRAFQKDMQAKSIEFPPSIRWWKTNELGTWFPKKNSDYPVIKVPEIAYIEYAKASNGELKGVSVTHESILEQCAAFEAATTETIVTVDDGIVTVKPKTLGHPSHTVVSYFEPRQQIGLILSVLHSVYAGNKTIFASGSIIDTPAIWIYVLSKYKATMALADYAAMKLVTDFYQLKPKEVNAVSKKVTPDLSTLRNLLIDTNTVQTELNQYIADKLLRPLCNTDAPLEVVCPLLSLPEHGGKIISMRDNLGPAFTQACLQDSRVTSQSELAPGGSRDVFTCLFDAQSLRLNQVTVLAVGAEASKSIAEPGTILVESFGFCMPNTTVAIVNPETATLCTPNMLGEVWIDSACISGGFYALPKHTESIYHARPLIVPSSENPYPQVYGEDFLRTGLCGTLIGGRLFVLGPYEERIRQQRYGADFGQEDVYFASDLLNTVTKRGRIDQCTVFEIFVKSQHLPIIACESSAPRADLARIATEIDEALIEFHGLRAYAILFVAANGLPRHLVHGRRTVHPLLTKRFFLQGQLSIRTIKIDVDRTIFNLPQNEDLWLSRSSYEKAVRSGAIFPHPQPQHTGMEKVSNVLDERTDYDLSRFTNMVDVLQWRTTLYPEETAYTVSTQSGNTINTKSYSWRKVSYKSAAIAGYLHKKGFKRNSKALVAMPFGIEYVFCIYACLSMGIIPVPVELADPQNQPQRINESCAQMVQVAHELGVSAILTNTAGDDVMRHNTVKAAMKLAMPAKYKLPEIVNISKAPKSHKTLGKESGFMVRPDWISPQRNVCAVILVQPSSDGRRFYAYLGHDTILNQCRTQKMTCQMRSQRGIVTTGLGTYDGLGFLHAVFCGVYVGCGTVLIPSSDFYLNPASFFELFQTYKTKDAFLTNALVQFSMNRINLNETRHIQLKGVQNLMLANDNRPKPLLYQHMARYFMRLRLEKEAINYVYSHAANPMITTRSYMLMEPLPLAIDPYYLRQGIVRPLGAEEEYRAIVLHDSGIVPSNTMVAIVNPETHMICPSNAVGEIWVCSDSNAKTYHGLDEGSHAQRFEASIVGHDPNVKYMRTGDFGFMWSVRRRVVDNRMPPMLEEGQCLYVLGPVSETMVRNGLMHFPVDVELSMERCHPAIPPNGTIVFQFKDELVAVVSVKASEHALPIVPLIVNTVLDHHLFLIDTVVIVHASNFPRSRFGDKMRRKALSLYVEKKLTAIYVKRITNQHQSLTLPQWSQSQVSISDDTMGSRAHSISDFDFDKRSLVRQDTEISRHSSNYE